MDLQQICPTYIEEEPVINSTAYVVQNQMMSPPTPQQPPQQQVVPYLENDYFAENDLERREGDAKVKEGLAFLRKFYNERASAFSEKRRNS